MSIVWTVVAVVAASYAGFVLSVAVVAYWRFYRSIVWTGKYKCGR